MIRVVRLIEKLQRDFRIGGFGGDFGWSGSGKTASQQFVAVV